MSKGDIRINQLKLEQPDSVLATDSQGESEMIPKTDLVDGLSKEWYRQQEKNSLRTDILKPNPFYEILSNPANYEIPDTVALTGYQGVQEILTTADFPLPFKKIYKFTYHSNPYFSPDIKVKVPYSENEFTFSYWLRKRIRNGNVDEGLRPRVYLKRHKAQNAVEEISVPTINISSIQSSLDTNGFYEQVGTGYKMRCNGQVTHQGFTWYNFQMTFYPSSEIYDNSTLYFGGVLSGQTAGDINEFYYTGLEYLEVAPEYTTSTVTAHYNGERTEKGFVGGILTDLKQEDYASTYKYDNLAKDLFDGCGIITTPISPTAAKYHFTHVLNILDGVNKEIITDHPKFEAGYKFTNSSGGNVPKYLSSAIRNEIFGFENSSDLFFDETMLNNTSLGFWIDLTELGKSSICFNRYGARIELTSMALRKEGYAGKRFLTTTDNPEPVVFVDKIDGDYAYLRCTDIDMARINIIGDIPSFTIYNPTIIKGTKINPYHIYKSKSEKNNSKHRGKWLMFMGDSQQNDFSIWTKLKHETGVNISGAGLGGHSMGYNSNNWMWRKDYIKKVMPVDNIDYYFFMTSSNDLEGLRGDLDYASVQDVYNNYYKWGDDATTEATKQALFDAMTEAEKKAMFAHKQVMSAYIELLQTTYTTAKFILASIPISMWGITEDDGNGNRVFKAGKTPELLRTYAESTTGELRTSILEVSHKHNTSFIDLYRMGGISPYNFLSKFGDELGDSVHWSYETKKPWAYAVWAEMDKIVQE